jgi:hypothetical protein
MSIDRKELLSMRSLNRRLFPLLALAALAAGCNVLDLSGHSPTETVTIHLGGECHTDHQIILCRDSSSSVPANRLDSVEWSLYDAGTGFPRGSEQKEPGDQVSFPGLDFGTYQVIQRVVARDGGSAEHVYPSLSISR